MIAMGPKKEWPSYHNTDWYNTDERHFISGIMPLYLFHEHWEIASRAVQPSLGQMFTLDVMGFAPDQLHTLPFLVYNKILYKLSKNDEIDDKTRFMIHLIEETCVKLLETNNKFRRQIIKQINDFVNQNEVSTRTAEVVKSINILT